MAASHSALDRSATAEPIDERSDALDEAPAPPTGASSSAGPFFGAGRAFHPSRSQTCACTSPLNDAQLERMALWT